MQLNTTLAPVPAFIVHKPSYHYHVAVVVVSFLWIFYLSAILSPRLFGIGLDNFWFDADVPRYICQAVDRLANDHWRNKVHPLFSFLTFPFPNALKLAGIDIIFAIRVQISLVVATGSLFLFMTLQRLEIAKIDSVLLIAIALSGATSLAWFSISESYAFSFSAFCILLFLASSGYGKSVRAPQWIIAVGLAFSITVTNIAVAIWAAIQSVGMRRTLRFVAVAIAAVLALAVVQRLFFPASGIFFLPSVVQGESTFFVNLSFERVRQVLAIFFIGSIVFPDVQLINDASKDAALTVQQATWGSNSLIPIIAILLLAGLLVAGLMTISSKVFYSIRLRRAGVFLVPASSALERLSVTVAGSIFFLVFLHLFYGTETFVYSGSFLPFLILVLAIGVDRLAAWKRFLSTGILGSLLVFNIMHGMREWHLAVDQVRVRAAAAPDEKSMARNTCAFVKRRNLI